MVLILIESGGHIILVLCHASGVVLVQVDPPIRA